MLIALKLEALFMPEFVPFGARKARDLDFPSPSASWPRTPSPRCCPGAPRTSEHLRLRGLDTTGSRCPLPAASSRETPLPAKRYHTRALEPLATVVGKQFPETSFFFFFLNYFLLHVCLLLGKYMLET